MRMGPDRIDAVVDDRPSPRVGVHSAPPSFRLDSATASAMARAMALPIPRDAPAKELWCCCVVDYGDNDGADSIGGKLDQRTCYYHQRSRCGNHDGTERGQLRTMRFRL